MYTRTGSSYTMSCEDDYQAAADYLGVRLDEMVRAASPLNIIQIVLRKLDPAGDGQAFSIEGEGNRITFSGTNVTSVLNAIEHYLREYFQWGCYWGGEQYATSESVPVPRGSFSRTGLLSYGYDLASCTYGYCTLWWDENRWLEELDWMVAHGINLFSSQMGAEYVWKKVWKQFGVDDLSGFFPGPAFLPWHRGGNVNGIGGGLTDEWLEWDRKRQHVFLDKARKLGMKGINQAFVGFAPDILPVLYPESKFTKTGGWCGAAGVTIVHPKDPLYVEVGRAFIRELIAEYGTDHYYSSDPFGENTPPADMLPEEYVSSTGKAVYQSLVAVDPEAIGVMGAWTFVGQHKFWKPGVVKAFLNEFPQGRLLILECGSELNNCTKWKTYNGYYGTPWIWNVFNASGSLPTMFGDIDTTLKNWYSTKTIPCGKSLVGGGFAYESKENNPLFYELLTDLYSGRYMGNLDNWLKDYCLRRYGANGEKMLPSHRELVKEVYGPDYGRFKNGWGFFNTYHHLPIIPEAGDTKRAIPQIVTQNNKNGIELDDLEKGDRSRIQRVTSDMYTYRNRDFTKTLTAAVSYALDVAESLKDSPLYRLDLVDVTRQCVAEYFDRLFVKFIDARDAEDIVKMKDIRNRMLRLLDCQVHVLATQEQFTMGLWIKRSERIAKTEETRKLYRYNTKSIMLTWGGLKGLSDYSKKDWAELVRDVYIPRMRMFIDESISSVEERRLFHIKKYMDDVNQLELGWENSDTEVYGSPTGDPVEECIKALSLVSEILI